jgi:RNA recognition motif-containing protein
MACRLFIANVPYDTTREELIDHLESAGMLIYLEMFESATGTFRGCGIAHFNETLNATTAIAILDGSILRDRAISVKLDVSA